MIRFPDDVLSLILVFCSVAINVSRPVDLFAKDVIFEPEISIFILLTSFCKMHVVILQQPANLLLIDRKSVV